VKLRDILFSLLLHAGFATGLVCGVSQIANDEAEEISTEALFFEIPEECVPATDSSQPPDSETEEMPDLKPPADPPPGEILPMEKAPDKETPAPPSAAEPLVPLRKADENRDVAPVPEPSSPCESARVRNQEKEPSENAGSDSVKSEQSDERECAKIVSPPVALGRIEPKYPRSARRRGREGAVTVDVTVSDSGEVSGVEIVSGSGYADLDSAAVSAVRSARFSPATEDGAKVEGRLQLVFEFKLR
jgi:protein TonB